MEKNKYNFIIQGDIAEGVLPDGTPFLIDTEMIETVSEYNLHLNWKGYAITDRDENSSKTLMLHWIVLGYQERPQAQIDHINRNKTDCRRCNLRPVTNQQNCMNRGIGSRNKTGYLGTFYNRHRNYYMAKICINNHQIYLLSSPSLERCAQAYNFAAELLFKDFAGYKNPVPDADDELKFAVYKKCEPYLKEAALATSIGRI